MANSYAVSVGTGATNTFSVPFGYLDKSHVHVYVDGVEVSADDFTWPTNSTITLPEAASEYNGKTILRQRVTPVDEPLVDYSPGNLDDDDLDTTALQNLYALQERVDDILRSPLVPRGESSDIDLTLPSATSRAGRPLVFDADGQPAASAVTEADLVNAMTGAWLEFVGGGYLRDTQFPDDGDQLAAIRTKQFTVFVASDLTELKKRGSTVDKLRLLNPGDGTDGWFRVVEGDYSALVEADSGREGIYLKMDGVEADTAALERVRPNTVNSGGVVWVPWWRIPRDPAAGAGGGTEVQCHTEWNQMMALLALIKPSAIHIGTTVLSFGAPSDPFGWQVQLIGTKGFYQTNLVKRYTETDKLRGLLSFNDFAFDLIDVTMTAKLGDVVTTAGSETGGSMVSQVLTLAAPAAGRSHITRCYMATNGYCLYTLAIDGHANNDGNGPGDRGHRVSDSEFFGAALATWYLKSVEHFFGANNELMYQGNTQSNTRTLQITGTSDSPSNKIDISGGYLQGDIDLDYTSDCRIKFPSIAGVKNTSNVDRTIIGGVHTSGVLQHNWDQSTSWYEIGAGNYRGRVLAYRNSSTSNLTGDGTEADIVFNAIQTGPSVWGIDYTKYYDTVAGKATPPQTTYLRFDFDLLVIGIGASHTTWTLTVQAYTSGGSPISSGKRIITKPAYAMSDGSGNLVISESLTIHVDGAQGQYAKATLSVAGGTAGSANISGNSSGYRSTVAITPV